MEEQEEATDLSEIWLINQERAFHMYKNVRFELFKYVHFFPLGTNEIPKGIKSNSRL